MAEAIGLGASVLTFIGLAGHLVQGCQYVRTTLDDVKDASKDLQSLRTEIKLFGSTIETFRQILADLDLSILARHESQIRQTLKYSEEVITGLRNLVTKTKNPANKWDQIRFAFGKDKYAKHLTRVGNSKGHILATQANLLLSLEHQQAIDAKVTHGTLGSLTSSVATTSTAISTLSKRLDDMSLNTHQTQKAVAHIKSDFGARLHDLLIGIDKIQSTDFSAFTRIISETRKGGEEVCHCEQEKRNALEKLKFTSEESSWLPLGMTEIVKNTFRGVLADFYCKTLSNPSQHVDDRSSTETKLLNELQSWESRRITSQHTSTEKYIRAIGIVSVHSTTTFCEKLPLEDISERSEVTSTVTQTRVELYPNPDFLRVGVYFSFVQQGFATFRTAPEPKLRVFHDIKPDSAIVRACTSGDLDLVQQLFTDRQASPFDRLWGERSLLYLVFLRIISTATVYEGSPDFTTARKSLHSLCMLYKRLVEEGLDPGIPRANEDLYGTSPISALGILALRCPKDFHVELVNLGRLVISHSTHDPFSNADLQELAWHDKVVGSKTSLYTLLETQDIWPISFPPKKELWRAQCAKSRIQIFSEYISVERLSDRFGTLCDQLGHVLRYDTEDDFILIGFLRECRTAKEILTALPSLLRGIGGNNCVGDEPLERRILLCLESPFSKFDLTEPSYELHIVFEEFRSYGKHQVLASAFLKVGFDAGDLAFLRRKSVTIAPTANGPLRFEIITSEEESTLGLTGPLSKSPDEDEAWEDISSDEESLEYDWSDSESEGDVTDDPELAGLKQDSGQESETESEVSSQRLHQGEMEGGDCYMERQNSDMKHKPDARSTDLGITIQRKTQEKERANDIPTISCPVCIAPDWEEDNSPNKYQDVVNNDTENETIWDWFRNTGLENKKTSGVAVALNSFWT